MHVGHCVVMLLSFCCHCGALDDCHVVGIVLRMLVHLGHFVVILLWLCCHCGALDDCHAVVMLLSLWCMLACCCHFVVILVHWMIAMLLSCCCHVGASWQFYCHLLSFWCIL